VDKASLAAWVQYYLIIKTVAAPWGAVSFSSIACLWRAYF